ncbi:MAG: HAMP domain-containing histidine kinase [Patescibacteria group bacterium]|nr:HAMP domain-containing histidine kinase [Patescibacteria group bacterium]
MPEKPEKKDYFPALNPFKPCKKYGIPTWRCPQFLFLIMGVIIVVAMLLTYYVAALNINDPVAVVLLVFAVAAVLLIISFAITQSFERIAEASRLKTEFIGIISHQLRSPLTNLKFALDFLASDEATLNDAQKRNEYFVVLNENIGRMGGLIDNLITVSKLDSGNFPLKKEPVSLLEIIQGLLAKFTPFAAASNVRISFIPSGNLSLVVADHLWLEQVVENLIDNSVKYTVAGGKVDIRVFESQKKLRFEIQDTGCGIPKEDQKYIFGKFFRSRNAMRKQTLGSGLGLYINKKVINLLGGDIGFRSEEGKGTMFYFTVPILKS